MKILLIAVAYLLGSTPFGYLIVKLVKGKDIRNSDSGATGATNVYRQLGPYWAALVAFCDVTKAYLPTRIAVQSWPNEHGLHMLVAIAASLGHSKSLFLGFKGGKAVSTSTGSFIALAAREPKLWDVFKFSLGVFLGAIYGSGYVS
ncbi:glycerol-3-phosphate acyltransferase, partial [Patescibacteria group bacterium]|nr:glycerol-3-phosphate acyltransferase [Patescibacteria group bacterium]